MKIILLPSSPLNLASSFASSKLSHRVANALDQHSHEAGAPSGAREISSSRAPISIVSTLFALQICDKVNAFGLAPPLAVQASVKIESSDGGAEKTGRTRPTYRNYWDRNFAHVGTLKKTRCTRCWAGSRSSDWSVAVFKRHIESHRSQTDRQRLTTSESTPEFNCIACTKIRRFLWIFFIHIP